MFSNLYSLVSSDLSASGILGIAFAGFLGMMLIWDARGNRQPLNQRTRTSGTNKAR